MGHVSCQCVRHWPPASVSFGGSASSILLWKVSHFLKLASLDCKDVALDLVSSKMIHDLNPVHQLIGDMEKNA